MSRKRDIRQCVEQSFQQLDTTDWTARYFEEVAATVRKTIADATNPEILRALDTLQCSGQIYEQATSDPRARYFAPVMGEVRQVEQPDGSFHFELFADGEVRARAVASLDTIDLLYHHVELEPKRLSRILGCLLGRFSGDVLEEVTITNILEDPPGSGFFLGAYFLRGEAEIYPGLVFYHQGKDAFGPDEAPTVARHKLRDEVQELLREFERDGLNGAHAH